MVYEEIVAGLHISGTLQQSDLTLIAVVVIIYYRVSNGEYRIYFIFTVLCVFAMQILYVSAGKEKSRLSRPISIAGVYSGGYRREDAVTLNDA